MVQFSGLLVNKRLVNWQQLSYLVILFLISNISIIFWSAILENICRTEQSPKFADKQAIEDELNIDGSMEVSMF